MSIPTIEREVTARPVDTFIKPVDTVSHNNERLRKMQGAFKSLGVALDERMDAATQEQAEQYKHQRRLDGAAVTSGHKTFIEEASLPQHRGKSPEELKQLDSFAMLSGTIKTMKDPKDRELALQSSELAISEVFKSHQMEIEYENNVEKFSFGIEAIRTAGPLTLNRYIDEGAKLLGGEKAIDAVASYTVASDDIEGMDVLLQRDDLLPEQRDYLMRGRESAINAHKAKKTYEFMVEQDAIIESGNVERAKVFGANAVKQGLFTEEAQYRFDQKVSKVRQALIDEQVVTVSLASGVSPVRLEATGYKKGIITEAQNKLAVNTLDALKQDPNHPIARQQLTNLVRQSSSNVPKAIKDAVKRPFSIIESLDPQNPDDLKVFSDAMSTATQIAQITGDDGLQGVMSEKLFSQFLAGRAYFNTYGDGGKTALVKMQQWQTANQGRVLEHSKEYSKNKEAIIADLTDDISHNQQKQMVAGIINPLIKQMDLLGLEKDVIEEELRGFLAQSGYYDDANKVFDTDKDRGFVNTHILRRELGYLTEQYEKPVEDLMMDVKEQVLVTLRDQLGYDEIEDIVIEGSTNNPGYLVISDASGVKPLPYKLIHVKQLVDAFKRGNRTIMEQVFSGDNNADEQFKFGSKGEPGESGAILSQPIP